jgi:hypothetical protein
VAPARGESLSPQRRGRDGDCGSLACDDRCWWLETTIARSRSTSRIGRGVRSAGSSRSDAVVQAGRRVPGSTIQRSRHCLRFVREGTSGGLAARRIPTEALATLWKAPLPSRGHFTGAFVATSCWRGLVGTASPAPVRLAGERRSADAAQPGPVASAHRQVRCGGERAVRESRRILLSTAASRAPAGVGRLELAGGVERVAPGGSVVGLVCMSTTFPSQVAGGDDRLSVGNGVSVARTKLSVEVAVRRRGRRWLARSRFAGR